MYCVNCGNNNQISDKFCAHCGFAIEHDKENIPSTLIQGETVPTPNQLECQLSNDVGDRSRLNCKIYPNAPCCIISLLTPPGSIIDSTKLNSILTDIPDDSNGYDPAYPFDEKIINKENMLDNTWGRSLHVWWAFSWRTIIAGFVASLLKEGILLIIYYIEPYKIMKYYDYVEELTSLATYGILLPLSLFCMKLILNKDFSKFRLAIIKKKHLSTVD